MDENILEKSLNTCKILNSQPPVICQNLWKVEILQQNNDTKSKSLSYIFRLIIVSGILADDIIVVLTFLPPTVTLIQL